MTPRRFRKKQLRLTGIYLARRWIARVNQFPDPFHFIAWWKDRESSAPARHNFTELALGAIRKVSPLGRRSEMNEVLTTLSDTLLRFKDHNEICWSQYEPLEVRLYTVAKHIWCALHERGVDQDRTDALTPGPWPRMKEAEAVARKLRHYIVGWEVLERALGVAAGALSGKLKLTGRELTTEPGNAGDISVASAVNSHNVDPNPELVNGADDSDQSSIPESVVSPLDPFSERLRQAISEGLIKTGSLLHLASGPVAFLNDTPVLDHRFVDKFALQLAEYGARLSQASARRVRKAGDQDGGHSRTLEKIALRRLWSNSSRALATMASDQSEHPRGFLNMQEYLRWPGRRNSGNISTSDGIVLADLLEWLAQEHEGRHVVDRSGVADAAGQTEDVVGIDDSHADVQGIRGAGDLADIINRTLAEQASGWFKELEAVKAGAQENKRRNGHRQGKIESLQMPALKHKLERLVTLTDMLCTFSLTMLQLALLPRSWAKNDSPKGRPSLSREIAPSVPFPGDDSEFGALFVLAQISRATIWQWFGYLLSLMRAAAVEVGKELWGPKMNNFLCWTSIGLTFDDIISDLRRELGCPSGWEDMDRHLRIVEQMNEMYWQSRMIHRDNSKVHKKRSR